ncbi:FimV/HubP family polar landmark protein [Bowmanella denitrificans]|uniref:FimV/HubP family polar landmark protein n=1 Tax=Bowmanella denitrificans TaxID=366582 RepID=UPI000C9D0395|nr:FimV/HubP family polar landmark protein [Bowmanella denitrificans]
MRIRPLLMLCLASFFSLGLPLASQAQSVAIKGPKNATREFSGVVYGPIESNDTLWRIAQRYRQNQSLSIYQVMVAIYELNPNAFEQQNLNLMVDGAMLRLPSEQYIARIDVELARQKAELDEQALKRATTATPSPGASLNKAINSASADELAQTRQAIEAKLSNLDQENRQQFDSLRQQIAASIDSVQALLLENNQVLQRLDKVNEDIEALRQSQEQDKTQLSSLLEQQNELVDFSREIKQQQEVERQQSWFNSPATMVAATLIPTLLLLGGLAMWLRRRNNEPQPAASSTQAPAPAPVIEDNPMDDLSDALTDELSGELETDDKDDDLFGEELLDDVLTDELEESLDAALGEDFDDFQDLADEMLVPEDKPKQEEASNGGLLDQGDLDDLFSDEQELLDEISDMDDGQAIDLSEVEESPATAPEDDDNWDDELDDMLESSPGGDEKPEISIDELLDEPMAQDSQVEDDSLDLDKLDKESSLSDEMIEQLDQEIASQGKQLDELTDELLMELEQVDNLQDDLADELLAELENENLLEDEEVESGVRADSEPGLDDLSDELLSELEAENTEIPETQQESAGQADATQDDLTDELLAELEAENPQLEDAASEIEQPDIAGDDLSDELLAELEADEADLDAPAELAEDKTDNRQEPMAEEESAESQDIQVSADELETMLDEDVAQTETQGDEIDQELAEFEQALDAFEQEVPEQDTDTQQAADAEADTPTAEQVDKAADEPGLDDILDDDALEQALADMEDESLTSDELAKELDELPALGDWLENKDTTAKAKVSDDDQMLDELESSDFDQMLESMDAESEQESEDVKPDEPELDLEALLNEHLQDPEPPKPLAESEEDFLDIDALLSESLEAEEEPTVEKELNLDVDLDQYSGVKDDEDVVDVDKDSGLGAKLDLARAYLEMEDKESAIELLQQVVEKGSPEQQQEAQTILNNLS